MGPATPVTNRDAKIVISGDIFLEFEQLAMIWGGRIDNHESRDLGQGVATLHRNGVPPRADAADFDIIGKRSDSAENLG